MTVYLIGAGPGDAELLTVKSAGLLARADAVVHDRLIGHEVLDLVPPSAERYPVGKRPGRPGPTQPEINRLLLELGHRLPTVVRVKGGDPFVFGRGIEEAAALDDAGIPFEVVPGISSALAGPLAAGISVTGRGVSSGVVIVTAHQDPHSSAVDWDALAGCGLTIVVLMGAARAQQIGERLVAGGLPADTPAATVTDATGAGQTVWIGRLADLGRTPVDAPSVLVIGPAVASARPTDHVAPVLSGQTALSGRIPV